MKKSQMVEFLMNTAYAKKMIKEGYHTKESYGKELQKMSKIKLEDHIRIEQKKSKNIKKHGTFWNEELLVDSILNDVHI